MLIVETNEALSQPSLVSVLIRTKDRPEELLYAVNSVLAQTYRPLEVIVVNDGGICVNASVSELLSESLSQIDYKYERFIHSQGRSAAANKALEMASGDYCLFLDDDDFIAPLHIEILVSAIQYHTNVIAVYSATECVRFNIDKKPEMTGKMFAFTYDANQLAVENFLPIHSVLFNSLVIKQGASFNSALTIYEDWHFWLQLAAMGDMKLIPLLTAYYRIDISGVGQPGTDKDYNSELNLFLSFASELWTIDQKRYLLGSSKQLNQLNKKLTQIYQERDCFELLSQQQQQEIAEFQLKLDEVYQERDDFELLSQQQQQALTGFQLKLDEVYQERDTFELLSQQQALADFQLKLDEIHVEKVLLEQRLLQNLNLMSEQQSNLQKGEMEKTYCYDRLSFYERFFYFFYVFKEKNKMIYEFLERKYALYKRRFSIGMLLLSRRQFVELWNRSKKVLLGQSSQLSVPSVEIKPVDFTPYIQNGVNIIVTQHTIYIGRMLESALKILGFTNISLLTQEPESYEDKLHIVVCPQMYKKMPGLYIAYQMEQSVSSRWFTKEYFSRLENSLAVLDYSFDNIKYLQEVGGLSYKQIFYLPVSNLSGMKLSPDRAIEYDIVFYGDPNNTRRQQYLTELKKYFNVKVVSEVFGEALYQALSKARVVVNIHYYENALLETTRVFECLSLGLHVVSETSSDQEQHKNLANVVDFVPVGDIDAMVVAIKQRLKFPVSHTSELANDINCSAHYLGRALLANGLISFEQLSRAAIPYNSNNSATALSLPETYQRFRHFKSMHGKTPVFTGLRHSLGWKGCALSYKFLCHNALKEDLQQLEICEDDAELNEDFFQNWKIVKSFLSDYGKEGQWDVFCGLMADVSDQANILDVIDYQGIRFVVLDRMMSMVYNIYNRKTIELIADWDDTNLDVQTNTIDRYLEKYQLRVVTTVPFLVGHLPDQHSTLWNFENSQYDEMIYLSQQKLQKKVDNFVRSNLGNL